MLLHPITSSLCTLGSVWLGSGTLDSTKNPFNPEFTRETSRGVGVEDAVGLWPSSEALWHRTQLGVLREEDVTSQRDASAVKHWYVQVGLSSQGLGAAAAELCLTHLPLRLTCCEDA